jgi:hypothetical protein
MATIIVEDGTVVSGANSYVSEATLTTYATDRGYTLTTSTSVLLIKAMDYLESLDFIGVKFSEEQDLQWPRSWVEVDGYAVDSDEIPQILKNGLCEIALNIDLDYDPLAPIERATKREKVDTLEVEYMDGASSRVITPKINAMLRKLLNSGVGNTIKVNRG